MDSLTYKQETAYRASIAAFASHQNIAKYWIGKRCIVENEDNTYFEITMPNISAFKRGFVLGEDLRRLTDVGTLEIVKYLDSVSNKLKQSGITLISCSTNEDLEIIDFLILVNGSFYLIHSQLELEQLTAAHISKSNKLLKSLDITSPILISIPIEDVQGA